MVAKERLTPRQRVLAAVQHRAPDRPPFFYRDTPEVDERLRRELGLGDRESLLRFFAIDFRWVSARYIGPPLEDSASGTRRDVWGAEYTYVPVAHGGNWEQTFWPLADMEKPSDLDAHRWPQLDWFDFSVVSRQLEEYREFATMTAPGVDSPSIIQMAFNLVGMERAMTDMLLNVEFFEAVVERAMAFNLQFAERVYDVAGDRLMFYRIGDDYGAQRGLLFGPQQWRQFAKPRLKRFSEFAHQHGSRLYLHSCGAVRDLIPDLMEAGVDVLDPLQVKAEGMAPRELKAEFGARLCFSGGVDEQELLPHGSPEQVRQGVHELLDVMAPGGGFFLGPTHNLQPDIPAGNIVAMYNAAREWQQTPAPSARQPRSYYLGHD